MAEVLAISPHPDDLEIFCGGTVATLTAKGYKVALLDLTAGELSTQGDLQTRAKETAEASNILGLSARENAALPDGALNELDLSQVETVVAAIRKHRPELLLLPYWEDRHPDHQQASRLGSRAAFMANVAKFAPNAGPKHHIKQIAYYQLRTRFTPSFVVDVSAAYETKLASIRAFKSQVNRDEKAGSTLVSSPLSLSSIQARDEHYGSMIGVKYGEGFIVRTALSISDPMAFFRANPVLEPLASPEVL